MEDGYIVISPDAKIEDIAPIDRLFRILAHSYGERAVGVILSGTGADGSRGLRRIKECDGGTFVQDPEEAGFNEMPLRSTSTDLADEVLPVAYIPRRIFMYKRAKDAERKQGEKALLQSEERYRLALKSTEMGAWDWNIEEDKLGGNDQLYSLLGLEPAVDGKKLDFFLKFVHPEDLPAVNKERKIAMEETGTFRLEFRVLPLGEKHFRWLSGSGLVVKKEGILAKRMVGVIYDITDRKALEQQKDEFIGIASHELKTPLTSIKAYAEMLNEMFEETPINGGGALIKKLNAQVNHLSDLISTLLDTTHIAEGHLPLHAEQFDLNELVAAHVDDLQRISQNHRLVFRPGDIGLITADRERIGQVLDNLISNAVKYSPEGGEITVVSVAVEGGVKVSVRDQGIGISPELQHKVFNRFFRVGGPQMHSIRGMGLGLYISAGIIHRHGGAISVESTPGEGSVFYFTLPYK